MRIPLYAGNSQYPDLPKCDNSQVETISRQSRKGESSTTTRGTTKVEDIVWSAWRHAEVGRNDQPSLLGRGSNKQVGQGSADKRGSKGSEHLFVGVEKLIGTRIVYSGTVTMTGATNVITFPTILNGASTDYIVLAGAQSHSYASGFSTSAFTMNGTSAQTVGFAVVRLTNATVEVN